MAVATPSVAPRRNRSWVLVRVSAATSLALLGVVLGLVFSTGEGYLRLLEFPTPIAFATVGVAVVSRHPRNAVGWLFVAVASATAVALAGQQLASYLLTRGDSTADWAAWAGTWPIELMIGLLTLALLAFPDGLPSRRWRPIAYLAAMAAGIQAVVSLSSDVNLSANFPSADHPLAVVHPAAVLGVYEAAQLGGLIALVAAMGSLVLRLRRSDGDGREQVKWVAYAAVMTVAAIVASLALGLAPMIAFHLFVPLLALGAGLAILRYRLYDIDVLINRTLVYAALTGTIAATYLAAASVVGVLVQGTASRATPVVLAAVIAGVFGPLRHQVQRAVNRLMYGQRDDPYEAISQVGRRLESTLALTDVLPELARTIAQTLRLPYAALEVLRDGSLETVASHGTAIGDPVEYPLVYRGDTIGRMLAGRRGPGEELSTADRRVLEDLARQAGVAVRAIQLTIDLQRSRERLVTAREEERRRLRRDLHDGLGPSLAGVALQLDNVAVLIGDDDAGAGALLARLKSEVQGAVVDIRRLVYDLRPPALDELGLVAAIRHRAEQLGNGGISGSTATSITVEAEEQMDALPAAVEVAAYRIVTEAMTNACRHSRAGRCVVRLARDGALDIEITDDGVGLPADVRPGVGFASMKERATELGGTCNVERRSCGGTRVVARLPVEER